MTEFKPGDVLDERYELKERVGLGGMAAVWKAADREGGGVDVAVKVLREDFLKRNPKEAENNVRRFRREAEILKLLAGARHVVGLRDSGSTDEGDHYLVMDLLTGAPLRSKVPRAGRRIGLRSFAWLARGLVAGLREIHAKGVIHRDLSPDNVFVLEDEQGLPLVKYLDFGIGKGADAKLDQVTKLVTIMGKPQYFSPEQARGGELTPASDVFSLSVILYELATGELPLDLRALPLVAAVKRIVGDPPKDVAAHKDGARLPPSLRAAIMRGMAKKAADRPTLEELAAEFDAFSNRLDAGEEFGETEESSRAATRDSGLVGFEATPWTAAEKVETGAPLPRREFREGDELGRFQVKTRLGRGGMGEVYKAWDSVLHRDVAIKVASRVEGEQAQQSILREARASSRLRSDHIVAVYDAGVASGLPYIVMEYVEGRTLDDVIEEDGPLVGEDFWSYAAGIVDGLSVAHENDPQVVHKDLKPANILIAGSVAKIADFGIASLAAAGQKGEQVLTGAAHGTVNFMSPEQAEGGRVVDARSDLYSLGCVFYMMTTGRPPFEGNEVAILYQHQAQPPEPPSKRNPKLEPPELDRVILKCLEKDPANRYASARDLQADLEAIFRLDTATLLKPWHRRTSSLVLVATALAAIVMALVVLKSKDDVRTLDVRSVADRPFEKGTEARFVVKDATIVCAYDARSAGDVDVRVFREGATEPEIVRTAAVEKAERSTLEIELPPPSPDDVDTASFRVELERVDRRGEIVSINVVRDLKPPTTSLRAYETDHAGGPDPIALLAWGDARVVVKDAGGFPGRPGAPSFEIADWATVRMSEQALSLTPTSLDGGDRKALLAKAVDFSGRETEASFVAILATLVLEPTPGDGAESADATTAFSARVSVDPPIPGFDPARDLAGVVFEATVAGASQPTGPKAAAAFKDGLLVANVPAPDAARGPVAYELVARKNGEPLKLAVKKPDGTTRRGGPTYVRDATPPFIDVFVDDATTPAAGSEAPNGDGAAVVVLRGPGAVRERFSARARDAGVGGAPRPATELFAAIDGAAETRWTIDAVGVARPPTDVETPCRVAFRVRDAAGNERAFAVRLERRLERVASARAVVDALEREVAATRPTYVNRSEFLLSLATENLDPGRRLFVSVDEGTGAPAGAAVPMNATNGRHEATVDLRTRGAPRCQRLVSVFAGAEGAIETEPLIVYPIEFDSTPPQLVVETAAGARVGCGGERVVPWAERLVVRARDEDAGSGLDAATVLGPVVFEDGSTPTPNGAPEAGAVEATVGLEFAADQGDAESVRKFVARASDRAGNAAPPCKVTVRVRPKAAVVVSFAGDVARGEGGTNLDRRVALSRETVRARIKAPASTPGFVVVATTYVTRGDASGDGRDAEVLSLDAATPPDGADVLLDLNAPAGDLVDGRTVFVYRERSTGRVAPKPFHEVLWRIDRKKPDVRVLFRGAPVDAETLSRGLRAGSAKEVAIEASDSGGFDPSGAGPGADFEETSRSDDRVVWTLKDDGLGGRRDVRCVVRDAAGNETTIAFAVDAAKTAPEVASATSGAGAPISADETWIPSAKIALDVVNDTVDAEGAQASVRPAAGGAAFEPEIVRLKRGGSTTFDVVWDAPSGGAFDVELFHYLEGRGRAPTPFWRRRVRVDVGAPKIVLFRKGEAIAGDDAGTVASVEELEIVASDAASGIDVGSREVRQIAPSDPLLPTSDHRGGDADNPRFGFSIGKYSGPVALEFAVRDRAGNRTTRRVNFVVEGASGGAQSASAPKKLSDFSTAEIEAERARVREMSGVELLPVGDGSKPRFYFSKTEVTVDQFKRFEDAYRRDPKPIVDFLRSVGRGTPPEAHFAAVVRSPQGDAPVVAVSEPLATAFCAWVGGALPTFDEWREAAGRARAPSEVFPLRADGSRDSRDRDFAWFDAPAPRPTGQLSDGMFGLRGMAGNASEWTRFGDSDRRVGVAGGSFKAKSSDYAECLVKPAPDSEAVRSVSGTAGVRVRWPALR